ncbi:MAG: hypothetical protein M5U29_13830 [Anaerolineae bacterium]|nr:hypothetical protein [Anaerolineae bacterium]
MDPEVLRGFLRIGMFVGVCGLVMALVQPRDSAEFVLSVCSALMGGALIVGVVILTRWFVRRERVQGVEEDHGPDRV